MTTGWLVSEECRAIVPLCGMAPSRVESAPAGFYILLQAAVSSEAEAFLKLCQIGSKVSHPRCIEREGERLNSLSLPCSL